MVVYALYVHFLTLNQLLNAQLSFSTNESTAIVLASSLVALPYEITGVCSSLSLAWLLSSIHATGHPFWKHLPFISLLSTQLSSHSVFLVCRFSPLILKRGCIYKLLTHIHSWMSISQSLSTQHLKSNRGWQMNLGKNDKALSVFHLSYRLDIYLLFLLPLSPTAHVKMTFYWGVPLPQHWCKFSLQRLRPFSGYKLAAL